MKLRRVQLEAIVEQLEGVEVDSAEIHITAAGDAGLRMIVRDRWGVDHFEIAASGLVTRPSVDGRHRA